MGEKKNVFARLCAVLPLRAPLAVQAACTGKNSGLIYAAVTVKTRMINDVSTSSP